MLLNTLRPMALAFLFLSLAACKEDGVAHQPPQPETFKLPVTTVQVEQIPRLYRAPGSIKSDERIEVSSRITGYIQNITAHEGDKIAKGATLIEIDPAEVEATVSRAQAGLKSTKTTLGDAEQDVSRLSRLHKNGIVSNEIYRKATVRRDVARSTFAQSLAALDTALAGQRYATIKSPINGVVVARHKQIGDLAIPGVPVLTIEVATKLLFKTSVAESRIKNVHIGDKVQIEIDALGRTATDGVVLRVIPSGDPVTRRYDIEIMLPSLLEAFPGMFGRAHFVIGSDKSPVVSSRSLVRRGGLRGVFVVGKDNKARFRWLRTGREWPDRVEVITGLDGGETILARDNYKVHDGDIINGIIKGSANE